MAGLKKSNESVFDVHAPDATVLVSRGPIPEKKSLTTNFNLRESDLQSRLVGISTPRFCNHEEAFSPNSHRTRVRVRPERVRAKTRTDHAPADRHTGTGQTDRESPR